MEKNLQKLIAQYNEQSYKQWLIISWIVVIVTYGTIGYYSVALLKKRNAIKRAYTALSNSVEQQKKQLSGLQKDKKALKDLTKLHDLCSKHTHVSHITALAHALPASFYLTSIELTDHNTACIIGVSPDELATTAYVTKLGALFAQATLEESSVNSAGNSFKISLTF